MNTLGIFVWTIRDVMELGAAILVGGLILLCWLIVKADEWNRRRKK